MGKIISIRTRKNIEAQGFPGLDDTEIAQLNGWQRFSLAVCALWTVLGVALTSPTVIGSLIPFALSGGILRVHPFDAVYNYGLRFLTLGPKIPAYGNPRRFGCLMAAVLLSLTAASFAAGIDVAGYLLGSALAATAGVNVVSGFCVPSLLYGKLFGVPKVFSEVPAVRS